MSEQDRARLGWCFFVLAIALIVVGVTGGCARNGLGGYEPAPIFRR